MIWIVLGAYALAYYSHPVYMIALLTIYFPLAWSEWENKRGKVPGAVMALALLSLALFLVFVLVSCKGFCPPAGMGPRCFR